MSTVGTTKILGERVIGVGGVQLLVRSWRPEQWPRGIVAIVPGFNSHDVDRDIVMADIVGWITRRLPS